MTSSPLNPRRGPDSFLEPRARVCGVKARFGPVRSLLFDLLVGAGIAGLASLEIVLPSRPAGMVALGYVMAVSMTRQVLLGF